MAELRCPCLSGLVYDECCGPLHEGLLTGAATAPTAERLMRARYSAFALGRPEYLLGTWHPSTRPKALELEAGRQWRRLDILGTEHGGPFDTEGVVEFRAFYRIGGDRGELHERSRFVREAGRWLYLDGELLG
ncbi:YchJ family protein [Compostimonas suwonensis]|uniref:UPF0225 protein CLV54_0081 n=1 Tax=Compostimonas suwonensis TaxID=1048394 RepID=A0A2M9C3G2_9MICO|nr:YchJ family protein [Compostimonas suwonensis]PJJ65056.1 SEC-C motif-containing protein [Compostimonas suwonensis]